MKKVYILVSQVANFAGRDVTLTEVFDSFDFPLSEDFVSSYRTLLCCVDSFVRERFKGYLTSGATLFLGFDSTYFLPALYSALEVVWSCCKGSNNFDGIFDSQLLVDSQISVSIAIE